MISVKENIKKAIENFINGSRGIHIIKLACPAIVEQVCDENGWCFELDSEYEGGLRVDWWATITTPEVDIYVFGSMYYGNVNLECV